MVTVKRIDVASAFRVGLIVSGLAAAVFGLLFLLLQAWFFNALFSNSSFTVNGIPSSADLQVLTGFSLLGLGCFYLIGIVFSAIGGGIGLAIIAVLYNLTSNWVGGLQVELIDRANPFDDLEKPKRI